MGASPSAGSQRASAIFSHGIRSSRITWLASNCEINLFLDNALCQPFADRLQSLQIALGLKIRTIAHTFLDFGHFHLLEFAIYEIRPGVMCRKLHLHAFQDSANSVINLLCD